MVEPLAATRHLHTFTLREDQPGRPISKEFDVLHESSCNMTKPQRTAVLHCPRRPLKGAKRLHWRRPRFRPLLGQLLSHSSRSSIHTDSDSPYLHIPEGISHPCRDETASRAVHPDACVGAKAC